MSELPQFNPGARLRGFPGGSMQQIVDYIQDVEERVENSSELLQAITGQRGAVVETINNHSADIERFQILGLRDDASQPTTADEAEEDPLVNGDTPDTAAHGMGILIAQEPIVAGDGSGACMRIGVTRCKVDVINESHTTAGLINGDVTKLESGKQGATILTKPSGTGEKWCLILLGGTSIEQAHPFTALLDADLAADDNTASITAADEDFDWADGIAINPLPVSPANIHGESGTSGDRILCLPGDFPEWEAGASYVDGDKFRAPTNASGNAQHLYEATSSLTAGSDPPGFDSTEEARYTDLGVYVSSGFVVSGVFGSGDLHFTAILTGSLTAATWNNTTKRLDWTTASAKLLTLNAADTRFDTPSDITVVWDEPEGLTLSSGKGRHIRGHIEQGLYIIDSVSCVDLDYT